MVTMRGSVQIMNKPALASAVRLSRPLCRQRLLVTGYATAAAATTRVRYIKRPEESKLFMYTVPPPQKVGTVTNVDVDEVPMHLCDLRTSNNMTLKQNGFELVPVPSGHGLNWEDREQVWLKYMRFVVCSA